MSHVMIRSYSTFFDHKMGVQFSPVLDRASGTYVGIAEIDESQETYFRSLSVFQVLTGDEYQALLDGPKPEAPVASSGDPLTDRAALRRARQLSGPPAPPSN